MIPTFSESDKEDICAHRPTLTIIADRHVWDGRVRSHSLEGNMNLESFPECFWGKCIIVHGQGSQWGWQPHSHRHWPLFSSKFPLSNQFIAMNKLYSDLLDWILTSQANKQAINSQALGLLLLQLTVHFHSTNLLKLKTECFWKKKNKTPSTSQGPQSWKMQFTLAWWDSSRASIRGVIKQLSTHC